MFQGPALAQMGGPISAAPAASSPAGSQLSIGNTSAAAATVPDRAAAADADSAATAAARLATSRTPAPPSEFQRFVIAATGRSLPVFGENYFSAGGQSFAPLDRVPVPADYVLGPGDELYIRAWGNIDIDYRAVIDRSGQINIPRVGTLGVAGLKAGDVEGNLKAQIGRVFKGFSLNVTLGQLRSVQIFVVGQARQPGTYTVGSLSTLVNAVFASGGPGTNGSMRRVQLRRGNTVVTELDLYDFIVQGNKSRDMQLLPGDVIVYTTAGPRVAVLGAVDTPAIYELKTGGSTLAEVMALAGGGRVQADQSSVQVERIDPSQPKTPRQVLKLDLPADLQAPMRDGDVLTVFPVAPQFANAVTLRGNVATPRRFPYTPGMRISQLIPERDALITPDYYLRKNRLVQFNDVRTAPTSEPVVVPAIRDTPTGTGAAGGLNAANGASAATGPSAPTGARDSELSVRNLVDEPNWEYATVERLEGDRFSTRLLTFNLAKAVLEHDPANDLVLQPGDIVTIFSNRDIRGPQARLNRLVRVEGEVDRPGVYQLLPGETLRALLARAGGFTPQAYVYGLEFSREETRLKQRENVAAAVARLESLAATQSARTAANRTSDVGVTAGSVAANAAISTTALQAQITRLTRLEPNGRIALELEPTASTLSDIPEVPLDDADRISVPTRPGFVTVAGAVVNNNAFLWKPGRTVGDYIKLAGLEEGAELSNMFVLRADGTVNGGSGSRGFLGLGNNLQSAPLYPGDALVVPSQLDFETWGTAFVRGLKDWSQILANFGLSAAAIHTLKQ